MLPLTFAAVLTMIFQPVVEALRPPTGSNQPPLPGRPWSARPTTGMVLATVWCVMEQTGQISASIDKQHWTTRWVDWCRSGVTGGRPGDDRAGGPDDLRRLPHASGLRRRPTDRRGQRPDALRTDQALPIQVRHLPAAPGRRAVHPEVAERNRWFYRALGDSGSSKAAVMVVVVRASDLAMENFMEPKVIGRP